MTNKWIPRIIGSLIYLLMPIVPSPELPHSFAGLFFIGVLAVIPYQEIRWFLGRKYNRDKKQGARTDLTSGQNVHMLSSEKIANEYNINEKTVRRAGTAVAKIEAATPEIQEAVRNGVISLPVL